VNTLLGSFRNGLGSSKLIVPRGRLVIITVKLGNSKSLSQEHFRNVLALSDRHNTKLTLLGSLPSNKTVA
jgi:hypothetical protein